MHSSSPLSVCAGGSEEERHRPRVLLPSGELLLRHPVPQDGPPPGQRDGGPEGLRLPPRPHLQRPRQERHHRDQRHHRDREDRR